MRVPLPVGCKWVQRAPCLFKTRCSYNVCALSDALEETRRNHRWRPIQTEISFGLRSPQLS